MFVPLFEAVGYLRQPCNRVALALSKCTASRTWPVASSSERERRSWESRQTGTSLPGLNPPQEPIELCRTVIACVFLTRSCPEPGRVLPVCFRVCPVERLSGYLRVLALSTFHECAAHALQRLIQIRNMCGFLDCGIAGLQHLSGGPVLSIHRLPARTHRNPRRP